MGIEPFSPRVRYLHVLDTSCFETYGGLVWSVPAGVVEIIPYTVMDELDAWRKAAVNGSRRAARDTMRVLNRLLAEQSDRCQEGVRLASGGRIVFERLTWDDCEAWPEFGHERDDYVILTAMKQQKLHPQLETVLHCRDDGMEAKARILRIRVVRPSRGRVMLARGGVRPARERNWPQRSRRIYQFGAVNR